MLVFSIEAMLEQMKAAQRFRTNLVRLMKESRLNGSDLARLLGVDPTVISRWINGKHSATLDSMDEISKKTGWDVQEFFKPIDGEEPPPKTKLTPAEIHRSAGNTIEALGYERPRLKKKPNKKAN